MSEPHARPPHPDAGTELGPEAPLLAALRAAPDADVRPGAAVRTAVLAAAHAATVQDRRKPGTATALSKHLGGWLDSLGAPRWAGGFASVAVAAVALGLWAGRDPPAAAVSASVSAAASPADVAIAARRQTPDAAATDSPGLAAPRAAPALPAPAAAPRPSDKGARGTETPAAPVAGPADTARARTPNPDRPPVALNDTDAAPAADTPRDAPLPVGGALAESPQPTQRGESPVAAPAPVLPTAPAPEQQPPLPTGAADAVRSLPRALSSAISLGRPTEEAPEAHAAEVLPMPRAAAGRQAARLAEPRADPMSRLLSDATADAGAGAPTDPAPLRSLHAALDSADWQATLNGADLQPLAADDRSALQALLRSARGRWRPLAPPAASATVAGPVLALSGPQGAAVRLQRFGDSGLRIDLDGAAWQATLPAATAWPPKLPGR